MKGAGRLFAPRGRTPLERLARGALLIGVFALVIAAYQRHFRNVAQEMASRGTVADALGVLTDADRAWIVAKATALHRRFGLELAVRLGGTPSPPRPDDPATVYLYMDPACQGSLAVAPPLTVSALPPGFLHDLAREHLDAACHEGRIRQGVLAAVGLLLATLDEAANRGKGDVHE